MKLDTFEKFFEFAQKIGEERGYIFSITEMENYIKHQIFPTSEIENEPDLDELLTISKP